MAFFKQKLQLHYNVDDLWRALNEIKPLFGEQNRVWVNSTFEAKDVLYGEGIDNSVVEHIYPVINEPFRGTLFEKILRQIPSDFGRARIMRLRPETCMHMHFDSSPRFQLVLETNPACYFYSRYNEIFHLPNDGYVYKINTMLHHTVINAGQTDRFHLVVVDLSGEQRIFNSL